MIKSSSIKEWENFFHFQMENVSENNNVASSTKQIKKKENNSMEYKKLQEKLNFLESKIMNLKSNIENNSKISSKAKKSFFENEKANINKNNHPAPKTMNHSSTNSFYMKYFSTDSKNTNNQKMDHKEEYNQQIQKDKMQNQIKQKIQNENKSLRKSSSKEINNSRNKKETSMGNNITDFVTQVKRDNVFANKNNYNNKNDIYNNKEKIDEAYENHLANNYSNRNIYYVSKMVQAFKYSEDNNYFAQLFREHLVQSIQAIHFAKMLKPVDLKTINSKKMNLHKKEKYNG